LEPTPLHRWHEVSAKVAELRYYRGVGGFQNHESPQLLERFLVQHVHDYDDNRSGCGKNNEVTLSGGAGNRPYFTGDDLWEDRRR
jgi:hypothetical protein